jgi:hypothetical protein
LWGVLLRGVLLCHLGLLADESIDETKIERAAKSGQCTLLSKGCTFLLNAERALFARLRRGEYK